MFEQTMIIGNLGKDPEMRYMPDGTPVTNFTVAVNKRWTNRQTGEAHERVKWYRVSCFRNLAETTNQYLKKGRQVMVLGEIDASAFIGNQGDPRATLELTARDVRFLGSKGEVVDATDTAMAQEGEGTPAAEAEEEQIPF